MNTLYYGDNLKILREYIKDESVDLIYLDPPFNSNRNYNVLFRGRIGQRQRIADHGIRRHLALKPRRRADIQRTDKRTRPGRTDDRIFSPVHRLQPDDGLSRHDGRPPKGTPPRPKTDRLALSPLRPDRFALFKRYVVNAGEIVYFNPTYKVIIPNHSR